MAAQAADAVKSVPLLVPLQCGQIACFIEIYVDEFL